MLIQVLISIFLSFSLIISGVFSQGFFLFENQTALITGANPKDFNSEFFPVAPFHIGDIISVRVTYTGESNIAGQEITLTADVDSKTYEETTNFSGYAQQATFYWILDTSDFNPGFLTFNFDIPELQTRWQQGLHLLPAPNNRTGRWEMEQTDCCTIHFVSGTAAEEDIQTIKNTLEEQTQRAWKYFSDLNAVVQPEYHNNSLTLVLVPIVVGHGGFASDKAVMTYSRRNWAGTDFAILAHHEVVHVIDRHLNDGPRPSLLAEGLAVYLSGGHYKKGDPMARAAAIKAMGNYLPLVDIADNFYAAQHEIGYMEAAALVAYLVERWGWEEYIDFYFNLPEGNRDSQIISKGLMSHFGMDLAEIEEDFSATLEALEPGKSVLEDVRLTIEIYDTLRRYQSLVIPSAHFRTAWWPPLDPMLDNNIVGDYAYREKSPFNVIVESKFIEMHTQHQAKNYKAVEKIRTEIEVILDSVQDHQSIISHYDVGWPLQAVPFIKVKP